MPINTYKHRVAGNRGSPAPEPGPARQRGDECCRSGRLAQKKEKYNTNRPYIYVLWVIFTKRFALVAIFFLPPGCPHCVSRTGPASAEGSSRADGGRTCTTQFTDQVQVCIVLKLYDYKSET